MKKMTIQKDIRIMAYDIDAVGIVSNIHYVRWFEDIRHEFLEEYYPYDEMMKNGISPMLMKTEVEYILPLTIQDHPVAKSWVEKMERMRWIICFEIYSGDKLCCRGRQNGCFWDMNRKRPTRVPERMASAFKGEKEE